MAKKHITNKMIVESFRENYAIVGTTCQSLGISRQTFYRWLKVRKNLAKDIEDVKIDIIGVVEAILLKNVMNGDQRAIEFYLKTKGRKEGFGEKIEVEQTEILPPVQIVLPSNGR